MDILETVYTQIGDLRQKGVKMKDIADYLNMPSSVLSAFYSTVLPSYLDRKKREAEPEALNYAFSLVNNVSKKRTLNNINEIKQKLETFDVINPFWTDNNYFKLLNISEINTKESLDYLGTYMSYSSSATLAGLKIEPFIFSKSDNNQIKIARKNAYGTINRGISVIDNGHTMYILLNEADDKHLSLVSIYLQIPFREKPKLLKGLYLAIDYNRNPIARRIVFIKVSDEQDHNKLANMKSGIISEDNIPAELRSYYDYTSEPSDNLRMCSIPSAKLDEEDLITEKKMLSYLFPK